jgi:hypothetical protein
VDRSIGYWPESASVLTSPLRAEHAVLRPVMVISGRPSGAFIMANSLIEQELDGLIQAISSA